jgi:N-methylhydantoinase A
VDEALQAKIGDPLGLDCVEAASGIFRIVNANMTNAIRRVSSQAGLDPRDFSMVVYGGNGPVHAGMQAAELGIERLLVPKTSPAFSALGLLIADHLVDAKRSYITPAGRADPERINALLGELEEEAAREFRAAGIGREEVLFERSLNVCYPGQTFDMTVPAVLSDDRMTQASLERTIEAFHNLHEALHAYAVRDEEPVVRAVRVHAIGRTPKPPQPLRQPSSAPVETARVGHRQAYFHDRFLATPIFEGARLDCGHRLEGPAIVEERFTTIVLCPGQQAELDAHGNYVIEVPAGNEKKPR